MKVRVIPSVLTDGISQVKGANFDNWRTVGVIRTAIQVHGNRDVDELLLLDVMASREGRLIDIDLVRDASRELRIPLTVGGGVRSISDMADLLEAGADKIAIGSGYFDNPGLVTALANEFGSQAIVCAIDSVAPGSHQVASRGGTIFHDYQPAALAKELEQLGCGELLVQNIELDGTMKGMDLDLLEEISRLVSIPVIGSSGAGRPEDLVSAVRLGCSAVACGALFQFTETTPRSVKDALQRHNIPVRK